MQLLYTLIIPSSLLFILRRLNNKYYFMQIGLVWFAICSTIYFFTDFKSYYLKPQRVYCVKNMETIAGILSVKKNISTQNWFISIKKDVPCPSLLKCPGFGAGKESYLFVPDGMTSDEYPLLIEYLQNHLEKGKDYLFFTYLKDSGGMNIIFRNSKHVWLTPARAFQLQKQFINDKVSCYDLHGRVRNFCSVKKRCSKYLVSFRQAMFANQCLGIIFILIGIVQIFHFRKQEHGARQKRGLF